MRFTTSTIAFAASVSLATAQTFTSCNPTKKSCPADVGLPASVFTTDFTQGASDSWSTAAYSSINYGSQGAEFSISAAKQAPTIETDFKIFFGRVDVKMRASPGAGIVSSIVLQSDDLDEIDWEFLGGDTTEVETNFFGKGNTTSYDRAVYYPVDTPQDTVHTYSVDWNSERILFIIDGTTVRTLAYNDPLTIGGKNYPQTPMQVKIGSWCGGCQGEPKGTVAWAGGPTTFDSAPYVMYVESVNIQNYNPADSYEWQGTSGSWQSIKIINNGKASSPTGQVSGTPSLSASGNHTSAPTKGHSVTHVMNTAAAVSKTLTGSSYSMNTASVSKQNNGHHSIVTATTQVPPANPSGTGLAGASASASTSIGAGSVNSVMASSSLFGLLISFFLL